ncbi:MAG: hydantoinase/oxoprolinase family protein [Frankiales bacterium]|nr:hydantoinase/oxoprolinase family protein [Frankiales bacterium]
MDSVDSVNVQRIGVDIGGTFTDLAAIDADGSFHMSKRLTTHGDEQQAVLAAMADIDVDLAQPNWILSHGSTLVINALLERDGARAALVTTRGFRDVLHLRRGGRPEGFNMKYRRSPALIPRELTFEIDERTAHDGTILSKPSEADLAALATALRAAEVDAVAVCFLNSYVAPANEVLVANRLRELLEGVHITASSELSRQWREYERSSTAASNAFAAPVVERYLDALTTRLVELRFGGEVLLLDSAGGGLALESAKRMPIRMVESGPVAGVIAAQALAEEMSIPNVVTFDMGGTTAKTALIEDNRFDTTDTYWIGGFERGFPVQVPTVDIIEVGAGGGSIASAADGRISVGPRSAGSQPGPACYGLGGTEPTITDANLLCGRIAASRPLGGLKTDHDAAAAAFDKLAEDLATTRMRAALGVLRLGTVVMATAVRNQTLERGRDPREFTMVAFGGAGPMHACEVAAENGIRHVLIPQHPGHFSAMGMLQSHLRVDRLIAIGRPLDRVDWKALHDLADGESASLTHQLTDGSRLPGAGQVHVALRMALRYFGQEHAVWIEPPPDFREHADPRQMTERAFEKEYAERFGHLNPRGRIEVVEIEIVAIRELPRKPLPMPAHEAAAVGSQPSYFTLDESPVPAKVLVRASIRVGERIDGPAIIVEEGATTVIPPGANFEVLENAVICVDVSGMSEAQS